MEKRLRCILDALVIARAVLTRKPNDAAQVNSHPVQSMASDFTVLSPADYAMDYFGFARVNIYQKKQRFVTSKNAELQSPTSVATAGEEYNYLDGEINQKEAQWHQI
jgi:hypothetical protein